MNCLVEAKPIEKIRNKNILQQNYLWAEIKKRQGIEPLAFEIKVRENLIHPKGDSQKILHEDVLVYLSKVGVNTHIAYVPYGPNLEPHDENYGVFLEELSEQLKPLLPKTCILIRYDLPWENLWSKEDDFFDESNNWKGPPEFRHQEYRVNFNTKYGKLTKSPSGNLPSNTRFIDVDIKEKELFQKMKPKTRYNIRLSKRKGVEVKKYGIEKLGVWNELYRETAIRNGLPLNEDGFFEGLFNALPSVEEKNVKLLLAQYKGEYLAGMIFVISKNRATYLYGASTQKHRNLMAPYSLQWKAIEMAREAGCEEYDMFGSAPNANPSHPMSGLYKFKKGFGGKMFHRMGAWDYPILENDYKMFRASEVKQNSFSSN